MQSNTPAIAEVFNTAELLEEILSNLSIDQLLITKRVTPHWDAVISTSPGLQRALFLRADHSAATRADCATSLSARTHNPLFAPYFQSIISPKPSSTAPACLTITHGKMRELLRLKNDPDLRRMTMFQPPCRYSITLPSASVFDITVKFMNEADVPIMRAVEKAAHIVELEADKKRNLRRNLDRQLAVGVRGAGMRHGVVGRPGAVNA